MHDEGVRLMPKWYTVAEVAVLLGYGARHSQIAVTMDIYAQVLRPAPGLRSPG